MPKKKLTRAQAFQKALQKWSDIIEGKLGVTPWSDCALCTLTGDDSECSYCPLVQYGGYEFECERGGSPWMQVTDKWKPYFHNICRAFPRDASAISAAMAMYLALLMARDSKKG